MNSAAICGIVLLILALGYRFYGSYVEKRVIECDDCRETPANTMRDGVDYEPTRPIILFGHHFSSIAGAGPIVGPILALLYYGWAATLGWIALGSIFAGAVHDYLALMISTRQRGRSMADICENVISVRAGTVFSIFLWAALILVIAAFGVIGAKSLIAKPAMVLPTFALMGIAMLFGLAVNRTPMPVWLGTLLAVGLNFVFIYIGYRYLPLSLEGLFPGLQQQVAAATALGDETAIAQATAALEAAQVRVWFPILMTYCITASLLPVWLLMQPRDYICVYKLFIGLTLGLAAVILAGEAMKTPAFTHAMDPKGGPIWPMLFVIVACGAISGFHSVVAGGTTVKQLRSEKDGKPIAYGGMILEGVLALLTVCLVGAGLSWGEGAPAGFYAPDLIKQSPLVAFATGFGRMVADNILPFVGVGLCTLFGMVMLKTFVLTSLDTCTRLARFVAHELVGDYIQGPVGRRIVLAATGLLVAIAVAAWTSTTFARGTLLEQIVSSPLVYAWLPGLLLAVVVSMVVESRVPFFRGRLLGTVLTILPAFYLGWSGTFAKIWPIFGAANQLIAALALIVASCYLLGTRRPSLLAAIPAVFMLFTTVAALLYSANTYLFPPESTMKPDYALGVVAVVLAVLAFYVAVEGVFAVPRLIKKGYEQAAAPASGGD